jgi:chloramphenicol 3-O-phosphotransferase
MQLVEYVNSLFEQGLSGEEVIAKTQEWKKKNNYGVSEQDPTSVLKEDLKPKEEEVKIEGAAEQTDATAPPKTPDASENLESGSGEYQFTPIVDEEATSERYLDLINKRALRFKAQTDFDNDVGGVKTKAILKQLPIGSKDRTDFYIQRNFAPDETINESYYNRASGNSAPNSYLIEQGDVDSKFSLEPPKLEVSKQTDLKSEDQIVQPIGKPTDVLGFDKPKKQIPDNFWNNLKEEFEEEKEQGIGTIQSYIDGYIEENDLDLDFPNLYFNKDNSTSFVESNYGGADAIAQTNLNPIDFEGFLNRNGYAEEFNEKLKNGVYNDSEGLQDGSLAKERDLRRYLNLYKSEQDARLNQKKKLDSIKKDPGKFKTSTFGDARVDLVNALSVPDESDVYYTSTDSNAFKDYVGGQFSISSAKDKEYLQKKINYAKELDERGDWYAAAANAGTLIVEAKNGFLTGWYDLSTFALELGGADTFVQRLRNSEAETQLAKDSSYYTSFSGKTIKIDGVEYAKDQVSGVIYNVSAGYNVSEINDPFRLKFLDEKIEKEGVVKEHNSLRGYLTVGGNTFGNVLTQVIGQKGVSFATNAAKVRTLATLNGFTSVKKYKQTLQLAEAIGGKAASRIRIPVKKSTFDAMLFQGSYGAAIGYNNTLKEAKLAGFNDEEASALAYDGSQLTGIWYAATGPISPRTNWLGKEGQETLVSQLRKSILKARKSNKPRTFALDFKQRLLNISNNLKSKGYNFVEEGTKETIQENVQQAGEFLWINPVLNKKAKTNFLQDTYSYQEAKTTSILSFATGGLLSQMKLPSFKPKASAMIANYSYIANNMEKAQEQLNRLVESGFATQAEADELVFNAKAIFNNTSRIPKWLDQNLVLPVAKLMQQKLDKQNEKKNIAPNFHQEIDDQIENIDLEIDAYIKTSAETQRDKLQAGVENFLNKVRKAKGKVDMVPFDTTAEANAYRQELLEQGAEIMQSDNYGDMVVTPEGNKVLIIDNQVNTEDNVVTTGVHEGGHFVLSETIDQDADAAKKMGNALVDEMFENENVTIKSDKIKRRLATYASQGTTTPVMMEEIMMMVSEGLIEGDIEFNETAKTRIGDLIRRTLQNVFGIKVKFKDGEDVLNFLRDYNRTIQTQRGGKAITRVATKGAKVDIADPGIEAARKLGRVKQEVDEETGQIKEVELDEVDLGVVSKESKRKLTPEQDKQAQDKVKEIQELQKESEALAKKYKKYKKDSEGNVLKDKQGNPVLDVIKGAKQQRLETELAADIKPTVDSFVESRTKALYDPIPADNKRNVTRQEFVESMKSDINAMIVGEFKAKQPLEKFITSRGFVRANSLAQRLGIKPAEQGIDQDIDTASNITTKTDDDVKTETETRTAQLPRATTQFTPDFVANLDVNAEGKTEAEVNEEIQKQFDEAIAKDLEAMGPVTTFGQTKDIGPALAALMEKATQGRTEKVVKGEKKIVKTPGIPAKVFMEKSKNIAKKYATSGALTAVKQYLDANAQRDFNNLPDAFAPGTGKATFIPENVKKALYKKNDKNQFVLDKSKTLADYKALLGDMTKPVYRASEAQTIKGLIALSLRNRIFEQAVPDAVERSVTGVKFSLRIQESLPKTTQSQVQNIGKAISDLENPEIVSRFTNSIDAFIDAIAVDDYNVEAAFNEVYGAEFLTKKNGDPTNKKTNLINEWIKVRQSGKGLKDFVKQTPSEITMRDYLYQAFEEQTESEVVENILGIKKGGVNFRSKDQIMGYVNLMNNYIASKYGKLNDKEIAEFVINELGPTLSAGAKVAGNDYMWQLDPNTNLLRLVPSTIDGRKGIRPSIFANQRQMSEVLIKPFLSEAGKNKLTYDGNKPLWNGKPIKKGQVSQKVNTYVTSIKDTGEISKELLDKSADFAQQKIETIVDFLNWYKSQKSNKEITVDNLGMAFRGFNGDMTALVRAAARVDSFAGDGTGPQRYEHNPPARTMLVRMAEYVNGSITEKQLRDYFSNYTVSIIPELMDDVINERYKDTSPLIGSRYYNAFTYGRFPFAMTKYTKQEDGSYEKTTIGEYQKEAYKNANKIKKANISVVPKALMSKRATNQEIISDLGNLDGALNQARRPDAPVRKIRVFDFDDTLARSKSKVLYTVPNVEGGFSEGSTKLKAIFMVGGPGAGKTNVGKGLQLGRRGYKVVNQDIALEAMKQEAGLPAKESDYTAEQRSTRSKLGAAARKAAVAKFDKYAAAGNGMVVDGTGASYNATTKKIKALQDAGFEVHMVVAMTPLETALERNRARTERSLPDFVVKKTYESVQESLKRYREDFGDRLYEINTETIEYGKPLPNDFLQQVYAGINANKVNKIDATEFAAQASTLESQGAEFDFREFSKVVDGKKGPLFSVAEKIAKARGTDDIFILTARPADAAGPIQEFMKANGIDLKLENIVGLGDGTAAAKGRWIASKAAEGYNDFYFADDAVKNVQAVKDVLSQVDVKSKVQQAKASKRITFDKVFNDIIEAKTGIESYKQFSAAKAKTVGASKGKFTFFTTPSAEDFLGLLYKTLGKGKVGDAQMAFYKTNLLDPYNRAEIAISQAKVAAGRDYKALKKQFKNIPKTLEKETGISKFTYQHAIRTYIWDSQGLEVPGLSKRDQKRLTDFIKADPELQAFADQLVNLQKGKPYPKPDKDWTAGNITTDVISGINKVNRAEYLQEWQENVDIIFSEKNMNKLEAAFGKRYVEALKDSLRAMKSGSNRPLGGDRVSDGILDWLNNSVGAIMFLNTRSAILQTISAVNFINWGDNNILKAGKAFANQKQFWSDFLTLMNSDYLLERRDGLKINVSESEIADAVEGSKNKVNAAISYLLNKGFVFTRYADSFAIASGGATFYRNRIEALVEQGMDRKAAEEQAFNDFRAIAEENQQSSSPSKISQQQRSLIGRIILQFGNTQLQYVRIQKRAVQDLVNGRGDWRSNISKIVYYGAIQNLLFNALQSGLAWALFDDDEDDEKLTEANKEQKLERALNGAIDSQLKGLGIQGAVIAGVKNALMTIAEQADKKSPKFEEAIDDLLSIAPALGSKIRKLKSAARTVSWNRKEIKEKGFSMDNPAYLAGAQTISAFFNIPLDRAVMKMNNMRNILNPATENWQKVALALGWSGWDVGLPYFGLAEDKPVLTETEKKTKKLFDLNKSDQVKMLLDLGLTKKQIRALTKEEQRVKEIIKLQNKNKDGK